MKTRESWMKRKLGSPKLGKIFLGAGAVFMTLAIWFYWDSNRQKDLEIWFLDVGQGDSALVRTQGGFDILIDGGPSSNLPALLSQHIPIWDKKIDLMILSHPHADHLVGLIETINKFEIGKIMESGIVCNTPECQTFEQKIAEKHIEKDYPTAGKKISIGSLSLTFLYPIYKLAGQEVKDFNNTSLVFNLEYKNKKILFTGDIGAPASAEILSFPSIRDEIDSDILKVPHHGSRNGLQPNFLAKVSPQDAVISVGKNKYGHPSQEIINLLRANNVRIWRTDKKGTIEVKIEESGKIKITSEK